MLKAVLPGVALMEMPVFWHKEKSEQKAATKQFLIKPEMHMDVFEKHMLIFAVLCVDSRLHAVH